MTLLEQVKDFHNRTEELIKQNPGMTDIWWEINDAPLEEMRGLEKDPFKLTYSDTRKRMSIQAHYFIGSTIATIFVFSKKVEVKKHVVVDDVVENV